ncbi:MAG: DUF3515 family protein [Actinomycetota bacterium]
MRSRPLPLPVLAVLLAVLVAAGVVGATRLLGQGPVEVTPAPSAADPACSTIARRLPVSVAGQARRATSSRSPGVAAWGDPAIVYLCGVVQPGPSPSCQDVNGVDWVYLQLGDGTVFTTYGRDPAVQVLVPRAYAPEPLRLPDFSAAVSVVPQGTRRCS